MSRSIDDRKTEKEVPASRPVELSPDHLDPVSAGGGDGMPAYQYATVGPTTGQRPVIKTFICPSDASSG